MNRETLRETDCIVINGRYFVPYGYRQFTHVVAIKAIAGWIAGSWHRSEASAKKRQKRFPAEQQATILKAGQEYTLD